MSFVHLTELFDQSAGQALRSRSSPNTGKLVLQWLQQHSSGLIQYLRGIATAWVFPLSVLAFWWLAAEHGWVAEQILPNLNRPVFDGGSNS